MRRLNYVQDLARPRSPCQIIKDISFTLSVTVNVDKSIPALPAYLYPYICLGSWAASRADLMTPKEAALQQQHRPVPHQSPSVCRDPRLKQAISIWSRPAVLHCSSTRAVRAKLTYKIWGFTKHERSCRLGCTGLAFHSERSWSSGRLAGSCRDILVLYEGISRTYWSRRIRRKWMDLHWISLCSCLLDSSGWTLEHRRGLYVQLRFNVGWPKLLNCKALVDQKCLKGLENKFKPFKDTSYAWS